MTEYKKLREEYREQRRAGTLKRRSGLPIGSTYLAKKDPEYREFLRLERAKERNLRRESLFKKRMSTIWRRVLNIELLKEKNEN